MKVGNIFPGRIEPSATVGGCIEIFENAWPDSEQTIKDIESEALDPLSDWKWKKAEIHNRGIQDYRTNYDLGITHLAEDYNNSFAKKMHNQFYFLLLAATIPYAERYDIDEMYHERYNLLKYSSGQEYKAHKDGGGGLNRTLSAICYLNSDYEGGELEFVNFGIKIKPEPGMLILFPSNYAYSHIAHPIISGTKYAIVTWIRDHDF